MSINFANVSDIVTPKGNVVKIHETNGGRVLWGKKTYSYNLKTKIDLLEGLNTLAEVQSLPRFNVFSYGGKNLLVAPLTAVSPYFSWRTQHVLDKVDYITQFNDYNLSPSDRATWFNTVYLKRNSYQLDEDKIKLIKWFVDTSILPPGINLRYYEWGKSGYAIGSRNMGDYLCFPFFIKETALTSIDGLFQRYVTIDGSNVNPRYWVRIKVVTNIGYDEKYIPLFTVNLSWNTPSSEAATNYQLFFYRDSTVAPDISESLKLG